MKRILIAYDGSPGAVAALQDMAHAGFPARSQGKVLSVADVWLPPEALATPDVESVAPSQAQARTHALAAVQAAEKVALEGAARLREMFPAWMIEHAAPSDSPAWGILEEARRWPADLIVIGSHGRSMLEKIFLGSVSQKVAAEAVCSVRVHRPLHAGPEGEPRILIAVDGSSDSDAAVEEALSREWPEQARFQLVTVVDQKLKTAALFDSGAALVNGQRGAADDWVAPMLAARSEKFVKRGFEVSTSILEGEPKGQLLKQARAWKADCIFLGARGLQHGRRLYLGTLASAVAARADCPVEIIRPRVSAEQSVAPGGSGG